MFCNGRRKQCYFLFLFLGFKNTQFLQWEMNLVFSFQKIMNHRLYIARGYQLNRLLHSINEYDWLLIESLP